MIRVDLHHMFLITLSLEFWRHFFYITTLPEEIDAKMAKFEFIQNETQFAKLVLRIISIYSSSAHEWTNVAKRDPRIFAWIFQEIKSGIIVL